MATYTNTGLLNAVKDWVREDLPNATPEQQKVADFDAIVRRVYDGANLWDSWYFEDFNGDGTEADALFFTNYPLIGSEDIYNAPQFKALTKVIEGLVQNTLNAIDDDPYRVPEAEFQDMVRHVFERIVFWQRWYWDLKSADDTDADADNDRLTAYNEIYVDGNYGQPIGGAFEGSDTP